MPLASALEQVRRESRERLHPSLRNPNWLILRRRRQIFEAGLDRLPARALRALDIGGRLQPYRPLLGAWRFLPEGLRYPLREFEIVEVTPEGNGLTGFFGTCNVFLMAFFKPGILAQPWQWTFVPLLNIAGSAVERMAGDN